LSRRWMAGHRPDQGCGRTAWRAGTETDRSAPDLETPQVRAMHDRRTAWSDRRAGVQRHGWACRKAAPWPSRTHDRAL